MTRSLGYKAVIFFEKSFTAILFYGKMIPILIEGIIMARVKTNNPDRWHFTTNRNAQGLMYLYAYQTRWIPEEHTSKRTAKRYVGRIQPDGKITFSPTFLEQFPQYSSGEFIYDNVEHAIVESDPTLLPNPQIDEESDVAEEDPNTTTRSVGLAWAVSEIAKQLQMKEDLKSVFGEDAEDLFNLALYKLSNGGAMCSYSLWFNDVVLSGGSALSGQRISELLSRITPAQVARFYTLRHKRNVEKGIRHYALDSTTISSYSKTIDDVAFGHAKRDPDLPVINYVLVTDQSTGEIVFTHTYEGSINDVAALKGILARMVDAGVNMDNVVLITDRGYSSIENVQRELNMDIKFVQGVRFSEDSVREAYLKHLPQLNTIGFYQSELNVFGYSVNEKWYQDLDMGRIPVDLKLHLFRSPAIELNQYHVISEVDAVVKSKNEGKVVYADLWERTKRFITETVDKHGKRIWVRNSQKLEDWMRFEGGMALRTNVFTDPFEALKAYRMRSTVELGFNQFKNWLDGDRLRCTDATYIGKIFITTLATSLRLCMLYRASQSEKNGLSKPNNSLDTVVQTLIKLKADKRLSSNSWVRRDIPKKTRMLFALLQVKEPPRFL